MITEKQKAYNKSYCAAYYEAHKEEKKVYREAHKEEKKAYDEAHKEEIKIQKKAYREAHREERKVYREVHKEEIAAKDKIYRKAHEKEIAAKDKVYREIHKKEIAARGKLYNKSHKKETKQRHLKRDHNLDLSGYDNMMSVQDNCCAICGKKMKQPNVDHDHVTGKIRGLLCNQCNMGLGLFQDNPDFLIEAVGYIERNLDKTMQGVTWQL